jgi:hypothetical protein
MLNTLVFQEKYSASFIYPYSARRLKRKDMYIEKQGYHNNGDNP